MKEMEGPAVLEIISIYPDSVIQKKSSSAACEMYNMKGLQC